MIWRQTDLHHLPDVVSLHHDNPAPAIHELMPAEDARSLVPRELLMPWGSRFHLESGAYDLSVSIDEALPSARATALTIAGRLDSDRTWFSWDHDDEEDEDGPLVVEELVSEIDGIPSIGPGGRIRILRQTEGSLIEVVVRARIGSIPSAWRPVEQIAASVAEAVEDSGDVRIRLALGYHEASSFEPQKWLRPAFVFLLDQPSLEFGARWRIALVEPATDTPELPPDAGLENAMGRCP